VPRTAPKPFKKGTAQEAVVNQGTSTGGFDPNVAGASYITSSIPSSANPDNLEKATEAQLNKELIDMTPAERIAYANRLRNAGYKVGNITGAVTKDLRNAWITAHSDLTTEIQAGQQLDLPTFLEINKGSGGKDGGVSVQTSQINDTSAAALVNQVYRNLVGQDATPEEIAQYTKQIRKAQMANPTKTVYNSSGSSMTTGGLDTQQLLTQQIQNTQPAIENRATDAYQIMFEELGGLR
jgi:hypothetical protein